MKIELAIFQMSVLFFSCLASSANEVYIMCKREANEITTLTSGPNLLLMYTKLYSFYIVLQMNMNSYEHPT